MKDKIIKTLLEYTDDTLMIIDLVALAEAIEELYSDHYYIGGVDWAKLDPTKWGETISDCVVLEEDNGD